MLNKKETKLAKLSYQHAEKTIEQMQSFIAFAWDFKTEHQNDEQVDFKPLDAEIKKLNKHINRGVKLSKKLIKRIKKQKGELTTNEKYLVSDLYSYVRGQEDFYECYDRVDEAKNEQFEHGMSYLMSRMNKAKYYIQDYLRAIEDLELLKSFDE